MMVPVELKRPSDCSPVLPVNGLLEDKTKCTRVHVAGVPLSSVAADFRLVVPFGCDGVERHEMCFLVDLVWVGERANESLACGVVLRLQWKWKRGSPLSPVVVRLKGALAVIDVDGCITADEGTSTL